MSVTEILRQRPAAYRAASLARRCLSCVDHTIEIGIAGAKAPCEPVPTALGNHLAVSDNLELTGLPRRNDGFNVEVLLDEGHETRDLGLVVLSCRAMNDLDLHLSSDLLRIATEWLMVRRAMGVQNKTRNPVILYDG